MSYEDVIRPHMSDRRYRHCINVSRTAQELAERYGADKVKARTAGILHDITKERSYKEQIRLINKFNIKATRLELSARGLLHAITGSAYVENVLGIKDREILNAIRYHTTARANMGIIEKIVFISDFISDERDYPGVERMRILSRRGLDEAMLGGISFTVSSLMKSKLAIHPDTFWAYNEAIFKRNKRKERENFENGRTKKFERYI